MHHLHLVQTVGGTPMVELRHLSPNPDVRLFAKLEGWNPTGSIKDRIVRHMLQHAERDGRIVPGDTVIEASTGNTGIALAMIGRALGYRAHIVMPENVYPEIPRALAVYGADVEWVPAATGVTGVAGGPGKITPVVMNSGPIQSLPWKEKSLGSYMWTATRMLASLGKVSTLSLLGSAQNTASTTSRRRGFVARTT